MEYLATFRLSINSRFPGTDTKSENNLQLLRSVKAKVAVLTTLFVLILFIIVVEIVALIAFSYMPYRHFLGYLRDISILIESQD